MRRLKKREMPSSDEAADAGLSLVEVIVSITILAAVMAAASLFFVNALKSTAGHGQREEAITLAQQAIEDAQSVAPGDLTDGRTLAAVTALNGTDTGNNLTGQDVKTCPTPAGTCPLNYDPSGATTPVIPLTKTSTVGGQAYTIRTFINGCWLGSTGACSPTTSAGAQADYRVTVDVGYATKGAASSCKAGCNYSLSALIDPHADPKFNTNISTPVITSFSPSSFAVGVSQPLVIQGSGFVANATVAISANGGTFGAVTTNTGTSITVPFTSGSTPATSYSVSVINPDGARASSSFTLNPQPTVTSTSPTPIVGGVPTTVTVNGTGFLPNAFLSAPAGTTVGATTVVSATKLTASVTGPVVGGTVNLVVNNPDYGTVNAPVTVKSFPTITATSPSSIAVSTPTTVTVSVTGLQAGATVGLTNVPGATYVVNAGSGTVSLTLTAPSTAVGTQTLTVTNPDGGSAAQSLTFNALPTLSSFNGVSGSNSTWVKAVGTQAMQAVGSGYQSGVAVTVVATLNGGGSTTLVASSVTLVDSSHVTFRLDKNALARGSYTFAVQLTNPDGGKTNTISQAWSVT